MIKKCCYIFIGFSVLILNCKSVAAQNNPIQEDTFFLAKKKGILGRLGKSISTTPPDETPVKVENPFLKYKGKIIRHVETVALGFDYDIDDTLEIKNNLAVRASKFFHKNTTDKVIERNLFFKTGDRLSPYLLADNERFLRELVYIKRRKYICSTCRNKLRFGRCYCINKRCFFNRRQTFNKQCRIHKRRNKRREFFRQRNPIIDKWSLRKEQISSKWYRRRTRET
jgi:hypothetical protein